MAKKIKNRIIITGGSGFIGSHLIEALKKNGYKNLVVIDKNKPTDKNISFIKGDFSANKILRNTIKNNDIIVHLACSTIPSTSEQNKEKDIMENVIGAVRLLENCRGKKLKNFIFLSSGGTVYGKINRPAEETDAPQPINAHGLMKYLIEKYIEIHAQLYGLNYTIVRASNPYGRKVVGGIKQGVIDVLLKKTTDNQLIEIWGDGKVVRDYFHIDDLTALLVKIIKKPTLNQTINVGSGHGISINNLLKIIKKITGKKLKIKYLPGRGFDLPYNILNINKAKKLYGWRPKIGLEDGIKKIAKL